MGKSAKSAEILASEKKGALKLDARDREIINLLSINSRTPLSQIAKALKTSTEVVHYRYNNLREQHVITDTFTVLDTNLLGVKRYTVYLQFHAISQEKMRSVVTHFLKHPHVSWVVETGGKWELILMVALVDEKKFDSVLEEVLSCAVDYLNDYHVVTVKDFLHKRPRYIRNVKRKEDYKYNIKFPYEREFIERGKKGCGVGVSGAIEVGGNGVSLDAKDIILLKALYEDARISLTELGKLVGLTKDTVDYRLKKMISAGVIRAFTIRLNYYLLEAQCYTIMLKLRAVGGGRKKALLNYVFEDERFFTMMEQLGAWDLSLMMFFQDPRDLRSFLISLKEKFSDVIQTHETFIHFDQYYFTYLCGGVVKELKEKFG